MKRKSIDINVDTGENGFLLMYDQERMVNLKKMKNINSLIISS